MATTISRGGIADITVPYGQKIAISSAEGTAVVSYSTYPIANFPETYSEQARYSNTETILGTFTSDKHIRIEAVNGEVSYKVATYPDVLEESDKQRMSVATITSGGTISITQLQGKGIYQNASGGNVTAVFPTTANCGTAFPDLAVGEGVDIYHSSNHATNTSTLTISAGITAYGSKAVTQNGGHYKLIKTADTPVF